MMPITIMTEMLDVRFQWHAPLLHRSFAASQEEIRAKEGNLSMPLYLGREVAPSAKAGAPKDDLPEALAGWMRSSASVRTALAQLLDSKHAH